MTRSLYFLLITAFLLYAYAPAVTADELTPAIYIDFLKPFEGSWKMKESSDGEVTEGVWTVKCAPTGICFLTHGKSAESGLFQSIDGYDPATKKWTAVSFNSAGEFTLTRYDFLDVKKGVQFGEGSVARTEVEVYKNDGTKAIGGNRMTCLKCDDNGILLQFSERIGDGQPMPDSKLTLERQPEQKRSRQAQAVIPPPATDAVTAQNYIDFVKPFEGSWKTRLESDGEAVEGTWTGRLSPAKTCYVTQGRNTGRPAFQSIDGYDPVAKKWAIAAFYSGGGFSLAKIDFAGVKKGQLFGKGTIGTAEDRVFNSDGTTTITMWKSECLECTDNRIVYVLSDRKENGEPKPDRKFTMERQINQRKQPKR